MKHLQPLSLSQVLVDIARIGSAKTFQEETATMNTESRTATTSQIEKTLLARAGAQLMDAAGMLRMEAGEWRSRKKAQPKNFDAMTDAAWADKCERLAKINEAAAASFLETARKLAEVLAP